MKRELWRYNQARQIVQGNFYVNGRRVRRKLASFLDAGLDDSGLPVTTGGEAMERHNSLLIDQYTALEKEMKIKGKESTSIPNSFMGLFEEWMDLLSHVRSKRTVQIAGLTLRRYLQAVGEHPIGESYLRKINQFTISLTNLGLGPVTVNIHLKALKTFLRWANEMGQLEKVPKIPMLRVPKKHPAVLSDEEISKLLGRLADLRRSDIPSSKSLFYRLHQRFLMVALGTGMRRSEIFWLTWEQIDLESGTVSVKIQTRFMIKEKKEKVVPIPEFLRIYLIEERCKFPDERWLLDDGEGELAFKHPGALTRAFSRHFAALGIITDAKVIHGFRAKYISCLWESGVDLQTVQELAGHSSPLITALYLTDPGSKKREAVKKLEGKLGVGFPAQGTSVLSQSHLPTGNTVAPAEETLSEGR